MTNRMRGTDTSYERRSRAIAEHFTVGLIEDAIRRGAVDPKDSDHIKLSRHFLKDFKIALRLLKRGTFQAITDHRESILREARKFSKVKKSELALLLYATWIEHFVNSLVEGASRKKGLQQDEIPDLIRDIPLKGKISWLLRLLELPPMALSKRKQIDQPTQTRNSFVHYKWRPKNLDDRSDTEQLERLVEATEGVVTYLKGYEKRHILRFSNKAIKKLLDRGLKEIEEESSAGSK